MHSAGPVGGSRNRHVGSSPGDAYEGTNIKAEWRKQLTAYVQWMNSQLKKKPGAHLVEDLRHDLRDGVALIDLIEVIAGEVLPNVHKAPSILVEMRENVDRVLQFMHSREIKMHNISTRDIVEGNLKATMRLILALAVHYKPNSVRHSSHCNRNSVAGIAQGASAALAEARRNATKAGHRYRRRQKENSTDHADRRIVGEEHYGNVNKWTKVDGRAELEGASANSSPTSSHNTSPRTSLYLSEPSSSIEGLLAVSGTTVRGSVMMTSCESDNALGDSGFLEICDSLKETHDMLFQLHELLLEGDGPADGRLLPGGKQDCAHPTETIVLLKGRLLHSEEVAESLKSDLSRVRKDCMELQGTKAGLQQRLKEQEGSLSSLKSENMRLELEKEKLLSEIETLRKQLSGRDQVLADIKLSCMKQIEDKDSVIGDMRREILKRDHMINQLQEQANQGKVGSNFRPMNGGSSRLVSDSMVRDMSEPNGRYQEERISILTNCLSRLAENDRSGTLKTSELDMVKDSILQTRHQASATDVPASKVDQLEDVIIRLLEKLHVNGSGSGVAPTSDSWHSNKKDPSYSRGSAAYAHSSTFTHTYSPATNCGRAGHSLMSRPLVSDAETNITYYTHGSDKPLSCVIHKRLGDVRLGDFKSQIQDPGCYHFFFKVLDPEYGTVKEEVSGDDDVLPGWDGKIVAWLEVEGGTAC